MSKSPLKSICPQPPKLSNVEFHSENCSQLMGASLAKVTPLSGVVEEAVQRSSTLPQFGTILQGHASSEAPEGSAEDFVTTTSHYKVSLCLLLFLYLPQ